MNEFPGGVATNMTIEKLVEMLINREAALILKLSPDLEELCALLEPYLAERISMVGRAALIRAGRPVSLFEYVKRCLSQPIPYNALCISDEDGRIEVWRNNAPGINKNIAINAIIKTNSFAAEELNDLLAAL